MSDRATSASPKGAPPDPTGSATVQRQEGGGGWYLRGFAVPLIEFMEKQRYSLRREVPEPVSTGESFVLPALK